MSGLNLPTEILSEILQAIPTDLEVYLVGGAVRDALLARPITDLDFTLPRHAIYTARRVANRLSAAFYPLDSIRDIGRVLVNGLNGKQWTFDFAAFQGDDLSADLRNRDFTINAMALSLRDLDTLIDPLGGAVDLFKKILRHCSSQSFQDDSIRILRAFRLATDLSLGFDTDTKAGLRKGIPLLANVSQDRLRDEIFRILGCRRPVTVLRSLDLVGALQYIFPELENLKEIKAVAPHQIDAFNHSLDTVQKLSQIIEVLSPDFELESRPNWIIATVSSKLGRYRQQLDTHLRSSAVPGRSHMCLLLLAALYHDIGKSATQVIDESGMIHFNKHESYGAQIAEQRLQLLRLSRWECNRISTIIKHHMSPLLLAQTGILPSRRSIYRFYRATGDTGLDICLLSLADLLATYGAELQQSNWMNLLDVVRALMEGWWERTEEVVSPPTIVDGIDLLEEFQLKPGPLIGKILSAIKEEQASGKIQTRIQALDLARDYLKSHNLTRL